MLHASWLCASAVVQMLTVCEESSSSAACGAKALGQRPCRGQVEGARVLALEYSPSWWFKLVGL